nr:hypothetical protein Iba_chr05aCG14570 [Ipomoea batatas]GMC94203.1 hypothetical protein Iba_chr05bCG9600 [Ipomoea batatas]GME21700.1 hypothetical protein Iba_scaffold28878CG0010 [Ipomoea batatas]
MEDEYGELGPECSVLNLSIFLLGLNGDPVFPAGEEKEPKSAPKSSDLNKLMFERVLGDIDIGDGKLVLDRSDDDDPLGVEKLSFANEMLAKRESDIASLRRAGDEADRGGV